MVSLTWRYCMHIILYIPLQLFYVLLLLNMLIYHIAVYIIDGYYYISQRDQRLQGLPISKVVNSQENMFYWMKSENNLSYNTMLFKMGNRINVQDWKDTFTERVLEGFDGKGEAIFPKFRQVKREGLVFSTWEYEGKIQVDDHSTEIELDLRTEGALEKYLSELESIQLATDRPEWHLYFISDPNVQDYSYIIWRFHHSLADGLSTYKVFLKTCDVDMKEELGANKLLAIQMPQWQRILAKIQTVLALPILTIEHMILISEISRQYCTGLTGVKKVAWTNKLDFEKIRAVKQKTRTTVNDVLISLVTESLRRYFTLNPHGDVIEKDIVFGSAIALEGTMDNDVLTNNVSGIMVKFPVHIEGVFEQLKTIHRTMNRLKHGLWPWFFSLTINALLALPIPSDLKVRCMMILNVFGVYSNVPGPAATLLHNGVPYREIYGIVMTSCDQQMGIVFNTYNGYIQFSVKVDTSLMDDPVELVNTIPQVLEEMYTELF